MKNIRRIKMDVGYSDKGNGYEATKEVAQRSLEASGESVLAFLFTTDLMNRKRSGKAQKKKWEMANNE